ncbi:MAG TPA: CARDB domain-containing protein [Candidatus Thermoplasmatota archaeon]|nr:CARDB domain-containing protein [Candidatus Thermoplasmatota archaeon]
MRLLALLLLALVLLAAGVAAAPPVRGGADLAVVELLVDPPRPLAGEPFRLVAILQNVGSGSLARATHVAFWLNDTLAAEVRFAASAATPLVPGARATVASPLLVHASPGFPAALARADSRDALDEADEANNDAWTKVRVSVLLRALANPTPGEPFHTSERFSITTTWDEPFARIACAYSGSLALEGPVRNGAFARACAGGEQHGADTFTLLPGEYALSFATLGDAGAAIYGVPHPEGPTEPRR